MAVVRDAAFVGSPRQLCHAALGGNDDSEAALRAAVFLLKFKPEAELDAQLLFMRLEQARQQLLADDAVDEAASEVSQLLRIS